MNQVQNNATVPPEEDPAVVKDRMECIADLRWARNDPQVQAQYWDQYVAVYQKRVVAHGTDMAKLLDEAVQATGVPRHRIMVVSIGGYYH